MSPKVVDNHLCPSFRAAKPLELLYKPKVISTENTGTGAHQSRAMRRAKEFDSYERKGVTRWFLRSGAVVRSHCHHVRALCAREEPSLLSPCQQERPARSRPGPPSRRLGCNTPLGCAAGLSFLMSAGVELQPAKT